MLRHTAFVPTGMSMRDQLQQSQSIFVPDDSDSFHQAWQAFLCQALYGAPDRQDLASCNDVAEAVAPGQDVFAFLCSRTSGGS